MLSLNIVKAEHHLKEISVGEKIPFSIMLYKRRIANKKMLDLIISKLDLDLTSIKIKDIYTKISDFGIL